MLVVYFPIHKFPTLHAIIAIALTTLIAFSSKLLLNRSKLYSYCKNKKKPSIYIIFEKSRYLKFYLYFFHYFTSLLHFQMFWFLVLSQCWLVKSGVCVLKNNRLYHDKKSSVLSESYIWWWYREGSSVSHRKFSTDSITEWEVNNDRCRVSRFSSNFENHVTKSKRVLFMCLYSTHCKALSSLNGAKGLVYIYVQVPVAYSFLLFGTHI